MTSVAATKADFARDWRNRHIAHRDAKIAFDDEIKPLSFASRERVEEAIKALYEVMNAVSQKYFNSEIVFDVIKPNGGAVALLNVICDGRNMKMKKLERMRSEKMAEDDLISEETI